MKTFLRMLSLLAVAALFTGCQSLDSRISNNQTAFNSWPAEVQQKIRQGRIDVGFTPAQVQVALGEADRKYSRTTERGTAEVWAYFGGRSGFSLGLGVGSFGRSSAYGAGVGYDTTTYGADDERVRVIFEKGAVVSVEARTK